jgi:hypothetical protein
MENDTSNIDLFKILIVLMKEEFLVNTKIG